MIQPITESRICVSCVRTVIRRRIRFAEEIARVVRGIRLAFQAERCRFDACSPLQGIQGRALKALIAVLAIAALAACGKKEDVATWLCRPDSVIAELVD